MTATSSIWKRLAVNAGLVVSGVVLSLGLGEAAVRIAAPQQLILLRPDIWMPVDTLGWAHRPNIDVEVNTGERTVRMLTDEQGFRVGTEGRPEGDLRILLLGDSFMAAMQVEHEQSLAGLIERCFSGEAGESVAVWNTGVGAWDPPQYLLQARRALRRERFDLVLVSVFMGNDVVPEAPDYFPPRQPVGRARLRLPRHLDFGELVDAVLAPINDALETRSHLFILAKTGMNGILMRLGLSAVHIPTELHRAEVESERWRVTGDILSEIAALARRHDTPALFVLIPAVQQVDTDLLSRHVEAFDLDPSTLDVDQADRLLEREGNRRRLRMVSTTEPLRSAVARGIEPYGRVDTHLSPEGHRVVWTAIRKPLAEALRVGVAGQQGDGIGACGSP